MSRVKTFVPLLLILLSFNAAVWAQTSGQIRGEVQDPEGKPLPGVMIVVSSNALIGQTRTAYSNELGVFRFPGLPVGTYSVEATMEGFQPVRAENINVSLDSTTTVPLTLNITKLEETVTTFGEAPLIDVTESSKASNYSGEMLEEVPTQKNITDLMQVSPGVAASHGDSRGDRTIAFGSNMQSNSWNVDGVDMSAPETGSVWFLPNYDLVEEIQVIGVGAPAEYGNHTGAVFNVVTKKGGNELNGSADIFFENDSLVGSNVELDDTVANPTFERDQYRNITAQVGGPIVKDKAWFVGSYQYFREASKNPQDCNAANCPGNVPDYFPLVKSDKYDIKLTTVVGQNNEIGGFFHWEEWQSPNGADPFIAPSANAQEGGSNPAYGVSWTSTLSPNLLLEASYSGWWSDDLYQSQLGVVEDPFFDFTPPGGGPATYTGGIYYPYDYNTSRDQFRAKATYYAEDFMKSQHEFKFGVQFSVGEAFTEAVSYGANGFYEYNYYGYLYRVYQDPFQYGAENRELGFFLDDTITVNDRLTLNVGIRFDNNVASIPEYDRLTVGTPSVSPDIGNFALTGEKIPGVDDIINWNVWSPRLGVVFLPTDDGRTKIQGSFGVYYDHNVTGNWDYPPPQVPPVEGFAFNPETGRFDDLLYTIPGDDVQVNKDIKAPRTLQYSAGFEHQFSDSMSGGVQYIYKDTKDLIGWEIIGGNYFTTTFTDPFTGAQYSILNIPDEASRPIIRKGNDPGSFPGSEDLDYFQTYHGVLFTFQRRFSKNFGFNANYTWSKSEGLIPDMLDDTQFNPLYGSRDGSDPNHFINASGRLQGDRPHMFRAQGVFFDLWGGINASFAMDLSSGRPFNRQIRVPTEQGRKSVIMERDLRHSTFKTIDVSVGKIFHLGNDVGIRVDGTIFNILNSDNELEWADLRLASPDETFVPVDWIQPRRLQLRLGFQF